LHDAAVSWQVVPTKQVVRDFNAGLGDKHVEGQMTRLRKIMLGGLAALVMGGAASSAFAEESGTFQNRLNGATIGIPAGAAAPPGLYSGLETAYLGFPGGGKGNQAPGLFLPAIAQAVPIVWSTGWNFLGANFSMVAVQAWYLGAVNTGTWVFSGTPPATVGYFEVVANTFWSPINLSWNLGGGWFVSAAFNFVAPDGSRYTGTPNPDYWTIEPAAAISYIANNWVASANFYYDINTASAGTCCSGLVITSGNALYMDAFAAYKIGKWEIGPVGFFEVQTTADSGPGCVAAPATCANLQNFAVGGLVGYDFGPVDIQVWVTDSVARQNAIDGLDFWTRLGFRIWAPEAPKPLVAKN
jgi:hypothetical protein